MTKKKIKILYTGGTIGSQPNEVNLLTPGAKLEQFLRQDLEELKNRDKDIDPRKEYIPDFEFESLPELLDSSNIGPKDWNTIAKSVSDVILDGENSLYEGVLILHGTDTMAYTASALAFMFEGLHHSKKSIVITGSQIPYYKARTDGRDQLVSAMILTAFGSIPEVVLYFNGKALRGCRSTKIDSWGFGAFDSPNFPPLGQFGIEFLEDENLRFRREQSLYYKQDGYHRSQIQYLHLNTNIPSIGVLKMYPGISVDTFQQICNTLDAIVIEGFGAGNGPLSSDDNDFLRVYSEICKSKLVLVITQCLKGLVSETYVTGLVYSGGINGMDMTTEAALAKLHYVYSKMNEKKWTLKETKNRLSKSIAGEMKVLKDNQYIEIDDIY